MTATETPEVHVHMQGQEALFSENMPLREVIVHLTNQLAMGIPNSVNVGSPFWTPQDTSMETGQREKGNEDKESGGNVSSKTCQANDSITSQSDQTPLLLIVQQENCPRLEEGAVSLENPLRSRRAGPGTSRSQEGPLEGASHQDVLLEEAGFLSGPDQVTLEPVPARRSTEGNSACEEHREGFHGVQKAYKCEDCPKVFRYFSRLKVHQRRHRNERTFVCAECNRGFFQASDLRVHQKTHTGEKPFLCSTCKAAFSHKTNLRAHERIHTGEKPYACPLCRRSYRQSSTYHRHLRTHQKVALRSVPSTPQASLATALM
nr:zinc finger and SCAN domain-containing protein 4 [Vicugna pacos]